MSDTDWSACTDSRSSVFLSSVVCAYNWKNLTVFPDTYQHFSTCCMKKQGTPRTQFPVGDVNDG